METGGQFTGPEVSKAVSCSGYSLCAENLVFAYITEVLALHLYLFAFAVSHTTTLFYKPHISRSLHYKIYEK